MKNRESLLRRLEALGFDISQCGDMSEERLAGWVDECEIIAFREQTGHLPPDGEAMRSSGFDETRMAGAFEAAQQLLAEHGEQASTVVHGRIADIARAGDLDELRRCGDILQALRDLTASGGPLH